MRHHYHCQPATTSLHLLKLQARRQPCRPTAALSSPARWINISSKQAYKDFRAEAPRSALHEQPAVPMPNLDQGANQARQLELTTSSTSDSLSLISKQGITIEARDENPCTHMRV